MNSVRAISGSDTANPAVPLRFKKGDQVRLTPVAMAKYGAGPNQGGGGYGVVIFADERTNDRTRPYLVTWESAPEGFNSYQEADLQPSGFRFQTC